MSRADALHIGSRLFLRQKDLNQIFQFQFPLCQGFYVQPLRESRI
jgi:hypothetical protein